MRFPRTPDLWYCDHFYEAPKQFQGNNGRPEDDGNVYYPGCLSFFKKHYRISFFTYMMELLGI